MLSFVQVRIDIVCTQSMQYVADFIQDWHTSKSHNVRALCLTAPEYICAVIVHGYSCCCCSYDYSLENICS